jgi:hypothetical protein
MTISKTLKTEMVSKSRLQRKRPSHDTTGCLGEDEQEEGECEK